MNLREAILQSLNVLALATGVAYAILAARRNRLCWAAGAVSSACAAVLSALTQLPMQAVLQSLYVGMSVYGWWSWRHANSGGELAVGVWPVGFHLLASLLLVGASLATARWLPAGLAAWPLLDSLGMWFGLFATWLTARARLESWLYWIVINALAAFLYYAQRAWGMAVLSVLLIGIAVSGFVAWRQRLVTQSAAA